MISLQNVSKKFGQTTAVDGINLDISQGTFLGLLGPNGAGKTTLIEMIEGLQMPDAGKISIAGKNWNDHEQALRNMIGISLQETRFMDKVTVWETLILFGGFYGCSSERCKEVMELVGLPEKRKAYTAQLSGGQRQKLALALALLNQPLVLLLDEPTTGLDPQARRELWNILHNLQSHFHTTMILTTHYMEEAAFLCDRIVMMNNGKIIADGDLDTLLNTYTKGEQMVVLLNKQIIDWPELPRNEVYSMERTHEGYGLKLEVTQTVKILPIFMEWMKQKSMELVSIESRKKTLDDLFLNLTGRQLND